MCGRSLSGVLGRPRKRRVLASLPGRPVSVLVRNCTVTPTVPRDSYPTIELGPASSPWFPVLGAPPGRRPSCQPLRGAVGGRPSSHRFNPAVPDDAYFPGPAFWRSDDVVGHPPVDTSGIIQPPVHAVAAAALTAHLGEEGVGFGQRIYPGLVAQNAYLRRCRTGRGGGLAFVTHPWETGMDNSPAWDFPLTAVPPTWPSSTRTPAGPRTPEIINVRRRNYSRTSVGLRVPGSRRRHSGWPEGSHGPDPGSRPLGGRSWRRRSRGEIVRDPRRTARGGAHHQDPIGELYAWVDGTASFTAKISVRSSAADDRGGLPPWYSPACPECRDGCRHLYRPCLRAGSGEVLGSRASTHAPGSTPTDWRGPPFEHHVAVAGFAGPGRYQCGLGPRRVIMLALASCRWESSTLYGPRTARPLQLFRPPVLYVLSTNADPSLFGRLGRSPQR